MDEYLARILEAVEFVSTRMLLQRLQKLRLPLSWRLELTSSAHLEWDVVHFCSLPLSNCSIVFLFSLHIGVDKMSPWV